MLGRRLDWAGAAIGRAEAGEVVQGGLGRGLHVHELKRDLKALRAGAANPHYLRRKHDRAVGRAKDQSHALPDLQVRLAPALDTCAKPGKVRHFAQIGVEKVRLVPSIAALPEAAGIRPRTQQQLP